MASVRHSCRVGAACTVFVLCCVLQCTAFAAVTAHTPCQHRSNSGACAPLLRGAAARAAASTTSGVTTVLFLPLDERFTTRDAFLHLALTTTFQVISPPAEILPHHKVPANLTALDAWMKTNMPRADAAIISAELYLYGGLIGSRTSNQTTDEVMDRLSMLLAMRRANPRMHLSVSTVIMRIPDYDEDSEEPWYWNIWGTQLYTYSYYLCAYNATHNATDLKIALAAKAQVPPAIVERFLWRRARNYNVTVALVQAYAKDRSLFAHVYITQDDNALYGFNIREANELKALVAQLGLQGPILIYPGADEVELALLSRLAVDVTQTKPTLQLVFRDPATINLVPNYEGQPMIDTLKDQIAACGGTIVNDTSADVTLLVNNFNHFPQIEAPVQPLTGRSTANYSMFDAAICSDKVLGFADNRYSNGADVFLIKYMAQQHANTTCPLDMQRFAYAGWNTDGNTLGTVIANSILLHLFDKQRANTFFNTLRIVEDDHYQAGLRQELVAYVTQVNGASVFDLSHDLPFYDRYAYKVLGSYTEKVSALYGVPWKLDGCYYPWNRTFEIGLEATYTPE